MGLAYCDGSEVAVSAGLDDRFARTPLRPDALIPSGSVTKPWTTVAMLQMVDQGRVELTTPAYTVVDPGLQKLGPVPGKQLTMSALWGHNPQMSRITIADLMGHSSGIHEYPGSLEYNALAGNEYGPLELIDMTDKSLLCSEVPCQKSYSSINYVLLGLAMVHLTGATTWMDWDQLSVIPQNRRQDYNATTFLKMGTCAHHGNVAHQYANYLTVHPEKNEYMWYDISDRSCLNGW